MAGSVLRIGLDGTPLLGRRTGVGRYTENLMNALVRRDDVRISALAFTLRGGGGLPDLVPRGVTARAIRLPARVLNAAWSRTEFPPVSLLTRGLDVYHGTNFVLPPPGRAGGVLMIHDLAYLRMPDVVDDASHALRTLVPRGLRRAAVVVTPSQTTADRVREAYGTIVPEVIVTPLGVDPLWLAVRPPTRADRARLGIPADYFLFVGTREPRKDLATLIRAYGQLRAAAGPDVPALLLVGPPGWGPELTGAPGVQLHDYAPIDDLAAIVAGARALIMPSRDEGFGLPALEALAAGTRVIVSDIPALREVTGDQASAVFSVGDADALARALADTMTQDDPDGNDESGSVELGSDESGSDESGSVELGGDEPGMAAGVRAARRAYAAGWTWDRCAERTVQAYRIAAG